MNWEFGWLLMIISLFNHFSCIHFHFHQNISTKMEQYLLPLPPIFQQEMDFGNNQHQNEGENEEDYYYEEEGDLFQWPSRFCADPLWVKININFVHSKMPD
jgi:hypothetical protein